jgi:hypothetical protein
VKNTCYAALFLATAFVHPAIVLGLIGGHSPRGSHGFYTEIERLDDDKSGYLELIDRDEYVGGVGGNFSDMFTFKGDIAALQQFLEHYAIVTNAAPHEVFVLEQETRDSSPQDDAKYRWELHLTSVVDSEGTPVRVDPKTVWVQLYVPRKRSRDDIKALSIPHGVRMVYDEPKYFGKASAEPEGMVSKNFGYVVWKKADGQTITHRFRGFQQKAAGDGVTATPEP